MSEIDRPTVPTVQPLPYGNNISLAQAKVVMAAAEACAVAEQWPMVIAIVNTAGQLVMLQKDDQAQLASVDIATAKAKTSALFRRATKFFEDAVAGGGVGVRVLAMPHMTPLEGGLPIVVDGKVIGGIGVSGMHSSQDAFVAKHGLQAIGATF